MVRQWSRNHRSKGLNLNHILQFFLLLAVCLWLIYQIKHSHDKKREFDAKASATEGGIDFLKLGRKGLDPRIGEPYVKSKKLGNVGEETMVAKNEKSNEEKEDTVVTSEKAEEEEEDTAVEKSEKQEDEDEDKAVKDEKRELDGEEEEARIDGENVENDKEKSEAVVVQDTALDDEKEKIDGGEKNTVVEHGSGEEQKKYDEYGNRSTQEEHHKADSASSAVERREMAEKGVSSNWTTIRKEDGTESAASESVFAGEAEKTSGASNDNEINRIYESSIDDQSGTGALDSISRAEKTSGSLNQTLKLDIGNQSAEAGKRLNASMNGKVEIVNGDDGVQHDDLIVSLDSSMP